MVKNDRLCVLENGESFEARLTFRKLYELEQKDAAAYKIYSDIILNGTQKESDYLKLLYTAYMVNVENPHLSYADFVGEVPYGIATIQLAGRMLRNPK